MRGLAAALLAMALAGCGAGSRSDLESPDPGRRAAAIGALGSSRDDRDLAALLVAQQDPQPAVRRAAAIALGTRGGARGVDGLSVLLVDPDPEVATAAARSLRVVRPEGGTTDARAVAELQARAARVLAQAYGRASGTGREEIAAALQEIGGSMRDAVEAEARLLWERNDRVLRAQGSAGRPGAAEELGRSGRAEAVRVLLPLLAGARADPALAAGSARGLGWCGDRGALEELEEALHGDAAEVAVAAAWALGNIGDASSADALAEQGVKGPGRAAVAAVSALEAMPAAPSVGVALCEIAVRSQDPAAASRAAAAAHARDAECPDRALAQRLSRGGPEALPALAALGALHLPPERRKASAERAMGLLQSSSDARIRTAAVRALGLAPHPSAVPLLQRRGQAAVAREDREAGGAGGKGTARPGPDAPGRDELAEIVVALARLDAGASFSLAHRLSRDEDPALRAAAAEAIGIAKPPDALARLGSLAQDGSPAVRAAALQSLGALGAPAVPPLSATLASSRDPDEVATVVRALAATGDATAVPAIAPMLSGPVAGPAASALGRLGGPAAAKALLGTLQRSQAAGRIEVVDALAALGPPETGEALARELLSDRPEVRAAAARGLGKIRHEAAAGRLEALRSDYYADVRRAAVEALARLPARAAPARP